MDRNVFRVSEFARSWASLPTSTLTSSWLSSRKYDTTLGVVVRPCAFGAHRMRIAPESVVTSAAAELVVPRSTPNDMDDGDDGDDEEEAARGRFF